MSEYLAQALNLSPASAAQDHVLCVVWCRCGAEGGPGTDGMHGTAGRVSQACYRSQSSVHSSGPRRRCRPRIKCRVQDHRCRARWMEPPWASSTASPLQQLACQRRLQGLGPRGGPPSRQECQVAGSWPPVCAAARGAQAQISVVKRWWGPQIPGPFILPMCSS